MILCKRICRRLLLATASLSGFSSAGLAQNTTSVPQSPAQRSRTSAYDAAYFAQYAPRTAYDMVQRIPGFTLDLGSNEAATGVDVRGFAGTAGNVVINGARPSSKSETLTTLLSRIPASRVIKIEVGPGDLYGADYASKSQVVNLVLREGGGTTATVQAGAVRHWMGKINPTASGSVSFSRGPSTFNIAADTGRTDYYEEGYDRVTDFATGDQLEFRRKFNSIHPHDPYVSGSWSLEQADNHAAHFNARSAPSDFYLHQSNHVTPTGDVERDDQLEQHYKTRVIELGGDVTRPLVGGAMKVLGLANRQHRERSERYDVRNLGGTAVLGGSLSESDAQRNETIGRVTWTTQNLWGLRFEAGAEAALNTLDYASNNFDIGPGGEQIPVDLLIENAKVNEKRAEIWMNGGRPLTKTLRVDAGINLEMSHLVVTGDGSANRKLKFLKPSVTLDWQAPGGFHTQIILRRTVAQLDFYDFVSSAELSVGRVNAGNANLQPQRTWEGRLLLEHSFLGKGKARLEIGRDMVSLLQDRILVFDEAGKAFDAPGNLGTGRRTFANLNLDAPLDRLWRGLHLRINGTVQRTRVNDPITGSPRDWSGFYPRWSWEVEARRDRGKFAYGIDIADRSRATFFRTDALDINYNNGVFVSAFIEYRPTSTSKLTLNLEDLSDTGGARDLIVYQPDRRTPNPDWIEHRQRDSHVRIGLTFRQSFGGGNKSGAD